MTVQLSGGSRMGTVWRLSCGSLEDPQDTLAAEQMLRDAGVIVTKSNYESTKLASAFLNALEERG